MVGSDRPTQCWIPWNARGIRRRLTLKRYCRADLQHEERLTSQSGPSDTSHPPSLPQKNMNLTAHLSPLRVDAKSLSHSDGRVNFKYSEAFSPTTIDSMALCYDEGNATQTYEMEKRDGSYPSSPVKKSPTGSKRKMLKRNISEMQDAVSGLQKQVDAASRGIQELRDLVGMHLKRRCTSSASAPAPVAAPAPMCVSPPASIMTMPFEAEELALDCHIHPLGGFPTHSVELYEGDLSTFTC